jgi:hypothetical protein
MEFAMSIKEMLHQKIDKLPDFIASDIMNYITLLENQTSNIELVKQVQRFSELTFSKFWDNEEDSVYDSL